MSDKKDYSRSIFIEPAREAKYLNKESLCPALGDEVKNNKAVVFGIEGYTVEKADQEDHLVVKMSEQLQL